MKLKLAHIKGYLNEPYPYYYGNKKRVFFLLLLISILSFGFSYFFEPFVSTVAEHKIDAIWILILHAFLPLPIAFLYLNILNSTIKMVSTWTFGKELFHLSSILLIIGIVGFLIRDFIYTNPDNWSFRYLWEEIRNTFLVGVLLLLIVLPINLQRLIQKHSAGSKKLAISTPPALQNTLITIKTSVVNETFNLNIQEFLYAKVESNYTEIFTASATGMNKIVIRSTLKELEDQLKPVSKIFKTHRSYLVNLHTITSISGNAQGYQLSLQNTSLKVPVSRSNIADFNTAYAAL